MPSWCGDDEMKVDEVAVFKTKKKFKRNEASMSIEERVLELEKRVSKLEKHLKRGGIKIKER